MKTKRILSWICCIVVVLCMLPVNALAALTPPSQAGERELEGGRRDFLWPVPGQYNLTSCYLDNRDHRSLDIDGELGNAVIASYAGKVVDTDTTNKTTGWGNFVLLEHTYTLESGNKVTMFSRYAHLDQVLVSIGDVVSAGKKIGTVGSTGTSTGSHLDFDIMYGSTSVSVDPYINELLELPDALYTTGGRCCQEYVAYVKEFYDECVHERYDSKGKCTDCGKAFYWQSSADTSVMGNYAASYWVRTAATPYTADSTGTALTSGQVVTVNAKVKNAFGQAWYEVSLNGKKVYVPVAALKLASYLESKITGKLTSLYDGQTLKPVAHRLDGTITSTYPLRQVIGYLDGKLYASWSNQGDVRTLYLASTDLNNNLTFGTMAPGMHTLRIVAKDAASGKEIEVINCTFYIEDPTPPVQSNVVTFMMEPENQVISLAPGQALGVLPTLSKEGANFVGWFTQPQGGEEVSASTVPTANMTLYPHWETIYYTVLLEDTEVKVPYGGFLTELPDVPREGYDFIGWYTAEGELVTVDTPITGDMILYPQWETEKTWLVLDAGDGFVDPDRIPVVYGDYYGELPVPVREGYVFKGWRLRGQIIAGESIVVIEGDHTAVAVWEKESGNNPGPIIVTVILIVMVVALIAVVVLRWLRIRAEEEDWV